MRLGIMSIMPLFTPTANTPMAMLSTANTVRPQLRFKSRRIFV
jgi:hypothetical protein